MPSRAPDCDLHPYIRDADKARAIIDACIRDNLERGQLLVRMVHGKGKGDFRKLVHSHLEKHPDVEGFILCDPLHGGSGATWVHLRRQPGNEEDGFKSKHKRAATPWRWVPYAALALLLAPLWYKNWATLVALILAIVLMDLWIRSLADRERRM